MKHKSMLIAALLFAVTNINFSQSIYVYNHNGLDFGDVFIGYSKNIRHFDRGAAKFSFYHTSQKRRDILVTFTLPNELTNGKDKIKIVFNRQNAAWSFKDRKRNRRRFNPNYPLEIRSLKKKKSVYIWLGGKIKTSVNSSPGEYKDTIILTVEFL